MVQAFSTVNIFEHKSLDLCWVVSLGFVILSEMAGARNRHMFKTLDIVLASGSAGWNVVPYTKSFRFDSQLGQIPRLWVQSSVGVHMRGNRLMFLPCMNVSLPLFLPPFPFL